MRYPHRYEYVTSHERLGHIANETSRAEVVGLDLETTPKPEFRNRAGAAFSPHYGRARLCSINTGKGAYVIDLFQTGGLGPLKDALNNPREEVGAGRPVVVGHNLKFDQRYFLHEFGVELWPAFCSFRASAILHNGKVGMGHNLWEVQRRELGLEPQVQDLGGSDWSGSLTPEQLDYAADDVIQLPRIRLSLKPKLAEKGLNRTALIEFGAMLPEAAVELNGFPIDPDAWLDLAKRNRAKRDTLARELLKELPNPAGQMALPGAFDWMFGPDALAAWAEEAAREQAPADPDEDADERRERLREMEYRAQLKKAAKPKGRKDKSQFNLDSNPQLLASLHRLNGCEKMEDTSEASLALFASRVPLLKKLLDYREVATRAKSFGPEYLAHVNPITGRIHADYYPLLVTGRYAHRDPNLGQIPRDKEYRSCFRPRKGRSFTIADYSNIEMVLMAEICADRTLRRLFQEGIDVHRYTASKITGKAMEEVTKGERQQAKPANFGFIYGLGAPRFVSYALVGYGVTFTLDQAFEIRSKFFEEFSELADWQLNTIRRGQRTLKSHSIGGRLRHLLPEAYNEHLNNPVQSSGADGLKRALRNAYFRFRRKFGDGVVQLAHHVHDEVVAEHEENEELAGLVRHELADAMRESMEEFVRSVPVKVEPSTGDSWADK